jgi:hypothetical protein
MMYIGVPWILNTQTSKVIARALGDTVQHRLPDYTLTVSFEEGCREGEIEKCSVQI